MTPAPALEAENTPVTREKLYQEVWSEPMIAVALRYGVSSSFMARVCTRLRVPRPPRGYWAKLAVGKAHPQPPLPEARPGDEVEWLRNSEVKRLPCELPQPPESIGHKPQQRRRLRSGTHPLVQGAREHFDAGRISHNGYIKPAKKLLLDLVATPNTISRALEVANEFFTLLEDRGHHVVLGSRDALMTRHDIDLREHKRSENYFSLDIWNPLRATVVFIGTVAIGITVFEMTEEVEVYWNNGKYVPVNTATTPKRKALQLSHWSTHKSDLPSGRFCIQAYSPYSGTEWVAQWQEAKPGDLKEKFLAIAKALERESPNIARLVEERRREIEKEHQRWEEMKIQWQREEQERRSAKAIKDSREELQNIIGTWDEARRIADFFKDVEQYAAKLGDDEHAKILDRIERARKLLGETDLLGRFIAWKSPDER